MDADILVVGAGLAGLSAAERLHRAGRDVVVLEARARVGGRVHSTSIEGGLRVDLGGQWIGPGQDRMYELARAAGVPIVPTFTRGTKLFEFGGRSSRTSREHPPLPLLALLDVAQIGLRLARAAHATSAEQPWQDDRSSLDHVTAAEWLQQRALTRLGRDFWTTLVDTATCAAPARQSALDLLQQVKTLGGLRALATAEQDFFGSGAQAIAEHLASGLAGRVQLSMPVRRIEHRSDGARVHADGRVWNARRVVLAVPLPLIPTIDFVPALPGPRAALQKLVVRGSVRKCVLVWERAYWRERGASGFAMTQSGPIGILMDGGVASASPGVLVALVTGRHAERLGKLEDHARRAAVLEHVRRCLPEVGAREPGHYLEYDWSEEAWSGGGYAARLAPGAWTKYGAALRAPVGPLHMAGTETATQWRSYMEGAVESGRRAADEILGATPGASRDGTRR